MQVVEIGVLAFSIKAVPITRPIFPKHNGKTTRRGKNLLRNIAASSKMKNVRLEQQAEKPRYEKGKSPEYDEDKAAAFEEHKKRIREELGIKD